MIGENYIIKRTIAGIVHIEKDDVMSSIPSSPIDIEQPMEQPVSRKVQEELISPASQIYENLLKGVQTFSPLIIPFIIHYLSKNSRKKVTSPT